MKQTDIKGSDTLKIRTKKLDYEQVLALPAPKRHLPKKPLSILRGLIRALSIPDMLATKFECSTGNMESVGKKPCLILMNHSAFIDLKIAYRIFFPKPLCVVCTRDSYIGKRWLMPLIGCIPTNKFVPDITLMSDISYALHKKKANVLMFPEAGYSLDGRATALPERMGTLLKKLSVPVVMVSANGTFLRQPLYNELITRKVKVSATVECLLSEEDIKEKSVAEIDAIIKNAFSFDNFKNQSRDLKAIDTPDRAKGLERILYRCPKCCSEGTTVGEGTKLRCEKCGKSYELDSLGKMSACDGETEFPEISDWVDWQRECVKQEIINGEYRLDTEVDIRIIKDHKALYDVGRGRLVHDGNGLTLTGCEGKLEFNQPPLASHSLNVDFYWYTIGDIIGIGNKDILYYCFVDKGIPVLKARLAAEEMYKLKKAEKRISRNRKEPIV
jgi:1-acyl-sn-glycerol-3-phosphate acyltransferase